MSLCGFFRAPLHPAFFALFDKKDPSDRNFILWVCADGSLDRNFPIVFHCWRILILDEKHSTGG
jgi:hypothetical protein